MPSTKPYSLLRSKMSTEAKALSDAKRAELESEMALSEIRKARQLSQSSLAQMLSVTQGEISKMEKRTDMYISTVRRFIEAMGGELEVIARFPDHTVKIKQFSDL